MVGLLIFRRKKSKISGFSGANSRKNRPILRDFRGKKSKFTKKSADFAGFSLEKSQNWQKNWLISRDFAEKSQNLKHFQEQMLRKIGRFHGKFRGKLRRRQETFSKKQPIWLDFFGQILLKSINFALI